MISACLIAKNEEAWIGECLENLKGLATEVIVVDTGSTDRTMEIAREKGARVSQIRWENDFAKARNVSLQKATQKWILIIDPDERIGEDDKAKIKLLTEAKDIQAYSFNTRNYSPNTQASGFKPCSGEYTSLEKDYPGFFESRKVRLFQNIPSIRFVGSVHELVETTIKGLIVESDIPFHHYGSTPEVEQQKQKKSFYQSQGKKKIAENPMDWKAYFELGVEYIGAQEYIKAYQELEKAKKHRPNDPLVLSNLGYAYLEAGKLDESTRVLHECLKADPQYHDAILNLGVVEMRRSNWNKAIQIFDNLVKKHRHSFLAFRNCGLCFAHLKRFQEAARCFEEALKIFPQFVDARIDLGITCFAAGRPDMAAPILEEALRQNPKSLRAQATLDDVRKLLASAATNKGRAG